MGREAQTQATVAGHTEAVKALLEATELILRGATLKRRYAVAALQALRVQGDSLHFSAGGEPVALQLGAVEAGKWLARLTTPPPTLAAKLGVSAASPALVLGPVDDAALAAALQGATTPHAADAALLLAVVASPADLDQAVARHAGLATAVLWVVHGKGRSATLGDTAIRSTLRACGYVDNKTSAVSDRLTATRYVRR